MSMLLPEPPIDSDGDGQIGYRERLRDRRRTATATSAEVDSGPQWRPNVVMSATGGAGAAAPSGGSTSIDMRRLLQSLSGSQRDAASALILIFRQYGLESLAPKIIDFIKKGYSEDTIYLLLQDTPEWKRRFKGNELRRQRGLPVLSPAEYLATERAYRQVLAQYGFPPGFYDTYDDFAEMIGRDLSPAELGERAQIAVQWANSRDQAAREAARRLYGLGPGDFAAYALDPSRALPLLQKQAAAVSVGAAALRRGLGITRERAEYLADLGVTADAAEQGYATVAQMLPAYRLLGNIYGEAYDQLTAEQEVFEGDAEATQRRRRLASQERAAFSGSSRGQVGRSSGNY